METTPGGEGASERTSSGGHRSRKGTAPVHGAFGSHLESARQEACQVLHGPLEGVRPADRKLGCRPRGARRQLSFAWLASAGAEPGLGPQPSLGPGAVVFFLESVATHLVVEGAGPDPRLPGHLREPALVLA